MGLKTHDILIHLYTYSNLNLTTMGLLKPNPI